MRGAQWVIDDFLCVGNFASAGVCGTKTSKEEKRLQLLNHGITHVVNCTKEFECPFQKDFEYLHLLATDDTHQLMIQFWPAACTFVEDALAKGGRVLVHCAGGHSRSGSTVVSYLMKSRGLSMSDALELAQERRPSIKPNPGFQEQLQVWHQLGYEAPSKGEFRTPATFPTGVMHRYSRPRCVPNEGESAAASESTTGADLGLSKQESAIPAASEPATGVASKSTTLAASESTARAASESAAAGESTVGV
jgi:protein-tyrosine phosphatase